MCNRIGEKFLHPRYGGYEIVEYLNCEKVKVRFNNTGYEYYTSYQHIKTKEVRDKQWKGKYGNKVGNASSNPEAYKSWYNMIHRVNNCNGYSNASISEDWLVFENFKSWFESQYKEKGWHLDKDILSNGSGLYSAETCCFLPPDVNTFFEKHKKAKGYSFNKRKQRFESYCRNKGRYIHLGMFNTKEDARQAYLSYKRSLLDGLLAPYKERIDEKIIKTMEDFLWLK